VGKNKKNNVALFTSDKTIAGQRTDAIPLLFRRARLFYLLLYKHPLLPRRGKEEDTYMSILYPIAGQVQCTGRLLYCQGEARRRLCLHLSQQR
jgi:hypothetical protein